MPVFFNRQGQGWQAEESRPALTVANGGRRTEKQEETAYQRTIDGLTRLYGLFITQQMSEEDLDAGIASACERFGGNFEEVKGSVVQTYEFLHPKE